MKRWRGGTGGEGGKGGRGLSVEEGFFWGERELWKGNMKINST